jgi:hypothetical protein
MFKSQSDIILLCFDMDEMSLINALIDVPRITPFAWLQYSISYLLEMPMGVATCITKLNDMHTKIIDAYPTIVDFGNPVKTLW